MVKDCLQHTRRSLVTKKLKWNIGGGFLCFGNAPTSYPENPRGDMPPVMAFLRSCMAQPIWIPVFQSSRCVGIAREPSLLQRVPGAWPSGLSMLLFPLDTYADWPWLWAYRAPINPFSAWLGHAGTSAGVHKLWCFTSSGNIASAPYINRNGVKFVALEIVVLWLHTTLGRTSAHLPFLLPSSIFLISSNIKAFNLSTVPLDWGCYTYANATFVSTCWEKS
jgi:hypothetical protein